MKQILFIFFSGMILMHAVLLSRVRDLIPKGLPDFTIFYTAGSILRQGQGHRLYDDSLQEEVQRKFAPESLDLRTSIVPYNHPPFQALLFVPFAYFPYLTSYFLWMAVNLALLVFTLWLLRRNTMVLAKLPLYLWCMAALAFYPIFLAFLQGQDSILLLLCYTAAFCAYRRAADQRAGACLAAALFKFNLVVPFMVPYLLLRKKLWKGFFVVAIVLAALGVLAAGWSGLLSYPGYVWNTEHNLRYNWNRPGANMANLRGVLSIFPFTHNLQHLLLALVCGILLLVSASTVRRESGPSSKSLAFAINLTATVLVSYHLMPHDFSLVFLVLIVSLDTLLAAPPVQHFARITAFTCIAALLSSPVYLVAIFRYDQARFLAAILLVLFGSLVAISRTLPKSAQELSTSIPLSS